MRRLRNFIWRLGAALREERQLAIGVPGLALAILSLLVGISEEKQAEWLGPNGPDIFTIVELSLLFLLIVLTILFLVRVALRLRPIADPVPALPKSAFHCKVITNCDEVRHINMNLVCQVFPKAPTPADEGLGAHEKNPRRLIGLVKTDTNEIVGWASVWPVSREAGRDIETGKRNDDELTAADLLPVWRNRNTRYLILRAFAILKAYRQEPDNLALKLGSFLLAHVIDEFICSPDRTIRLVAIAYTKEGAKLCNAFGLKENGHEADYPDIGKKPIWAADVTMKDLYRRLGSR